MLLLTVKLFEYEEKPEAAYIEEVYVRTLNCLRQHIEPIKNSWCQRELYHLISLQN